jgi:hypothetical protein
VASRIQTKGVCASRRREAEEREAFKAAYDAVTSFCDVYSLLLDEPPSISPIVFMHEENCADATITYFSVGHGSFRFHSPDGSAEAEWNERNAKIFRRLLPALEIAGGECGTAPSDLAQQIRIALKMYRHGELAAAIGIEFLCKFSALEGLVCGHLRANKERLLIARISTLFRGHGSWDVKVRSLWRQRCAASHQSLAFSDVFVQATKDVEYIFLGVVIFAISHLDHATCVEDLWNFASRFSLPEEAVLERKTLHGRVSSAMMPLNLTWVGFGKLIDDTFNQRERGEGPFATGAS